MHPHTCRTNCPSSCLFTHRPITSLEDSTCDPKLLCSSREGEEARRAERREDALQRQRVQFTSMPLLLRADDPGYKRVAAHPDALHRFAICGPSPVGAEKEPGRVATVTGGVAVEERKRLVELLFESQPDRVSFLSVLSEAQRQRLVYLLARRDVAEGEVVVEQGDALVQPLPLLSFRCPPCLCCLSSSLPPHSAHLRFLPAARRSTTATLTHPSPSPSPDPDPNQVDHCYFVEEGTFEVLHRKDHWEGEESEEGQEQEATFASLPPTPAAPPTMLTPPAPPTHPTPAAFPPSARPTSSSTTTTTTTTTTSFSSSIKLYILIKTVAPPLDALLLD